MKIEKPNWKSIIRTKSHATISGFVTIYPDLDKWFQESVEPVNKMLEDAIQFNCWSEPVIATSNNIGYRERWRPIDQFPVSDSKLVKTAILINIQEIKPLSKGERAIELLKRWKEDIDVIGIGCAENELDLPGLSDLWHETMNLLEETESHEEN